jgi:hypothetical protein
MIHTLARILLVTTIAWVLSGVSSSARADELVVLPQDLEIELALSALPVGLQDAASIYIRDPKKGFVLHREGSNGFVTFVARTSTRFYEANWAYTYPSDQLIPIAYDSVGAKHHIVPYFDLERMRIAGVPPDEARKTLRKRFSDGTYEAPTKGGISYMFAPIHRAYGAPAKSDEMITVSFPHYMPYAPDVVSAELGAMDPHGRAGILDHGGRNAGPHGYLYFMVPADQADQIRKKYAATLDRLCKLNTNWCLPVT